MRLNKKLVAAGVGTALALALGGVALAYWTTTGAGTGNATNASSSGTVLLHASYADGLTPGASETVAYTADNAGSSSLYVGTITPTVSIDAAHSTCLASDFVINPTVSNVTLAAGASNVSVGTGNILFKDTALNQDGCKGAVVTLTLASN